MIRHRVLFLAFTLYVGAAAFAAGEVVPWSQGVSYTYDGSGNIRQIGKDRFAYDVAGRLIQAEVNGIRREYTYDAFGNRTGCVQAAGTPLQTDCQQGRTISSACNRVDGRDDKLAAARHPVGNSVETYYYHLDHLGTPRRITDAADATAGIHDYHPFGPEIPGGRQEPTPTPLQYTGHERDHWLPGGSDTLDYMHARYYSPAMGRFLSVDPGRDFDTHQPQSWNMYAYVRNSPINATDPTGRWIETAWDIANIVMGAKSAYDNYKAGNYGSAALDAGGMVVDVVTVLVPLVPGGAGTAIKGVRAANAIDNTVDAGHTADLATATARGRASESRVLESMGMTKNTQKVTTRSGTSIPDAQDSTRVVDVKDTQRASNTNQMRVQREHAQATGRDHVVVTGKNTKVSKPLEESSTVVRRDDLGPPR
jgi:RHS repeat-associated protein